ncbi:unnamed protein product [Soboliphyme baturini]|uniref:Cyclic nucleotide-binding domain-containing protein n=1 Tax=Soboliphyme baturini TaxID=241478 RepID=A0A183ISM9_9BILA|nr:unnamed protein product [Soboliphyme baturini]
MIHDRKVNGKLYKDCMVGTAMVDWLLNNCKATVQTRTQAIGIWQVLLEEGLITHVTNEYSFLDKYLLYRWNEGSSPSKDDGLTGIEGDLTTEQEINDAVVYLSLVGPDAVFRMILSKAPSDRTSEEIDIVFEELLSIKAFSHLSTMVKRELAAVMMFEHHQNAGTVLFRQGEVGKSWFIILKGSVNVVIYGKGTVCTLREGDDFGKLALVNDAPRAATIILNEDNCQFLRVDKNDFDRILRDVEANTVRLKEHGYDVLVLEKFPVMCTSFENSKVMPQHRYEKLLKTK